jgi:hypothetical protein
MQTGDESEDRRQVAEGIPSSFGMGRLDFFNAEVAKGDAQKRRVFALQSRLITMPTEIM